MPELFGSDVTIRSANRNHFGHFDSIGWGKNTKLDFQIKHSFLIPSIDPKNLRNTGNVVEMHELLRIDVTIRYADSDKKITKSFLL